MPTAKHAPHHSVHAAPLYFKAGAWGPWERLYTVCEGEEGMISQLLQIIWLPPPHYPPPRLLFGQCGECFDECLGVDCRCVKARVRETTLKSWSELPQSHSANTAGSTILLLMCSLERQPQLVYVVLEA